MPDYKKPTKEECEVIKKLASELHAAKVKEASAKADRVAIEAKLSCLIPGEDEGQRTVTVGKDKVTVKRGLTYSADTEEIEALCNEHSKHLPVKSSTTKSLDLNGYRWFEKNDPEFFGLLTDLVQVKPKKTAVTVKLGG